MGGEFDEGIGGAQVASDGRSGRGRATRAPVWHALLWLACLLAPCACSVERVPRDAPCTYNSECRDALVCSDGRCRAQCVENRDCEPLWTCGASGFPGVRACLPPESPVLCAFHSECPPQALCISGRCRSRCVEDVDCPDTSVCVAGVCDGTLTHAGSDAGVVAADAGGIRCAMGRTRCGDACVELSSARDHCGGCGLACPDGELCRGGECSCLAPNTVCGAACVDLASSSSQCGACDARCDGPCHDGVCCGAGLARCGEACIDVTSDPSNCGDCAQACSALAACVGGQCRAPNDACADASPIELLPGERTIVFGTNSEGQVVSHSVQSCFSGSDLFYRLRLPRRSVVLARLLSFGGAARAMLGYARTDCALEPARCPVPQCASGGGREAALAQVLEAGEHVLVLDGLNAGNELTLLAVPIDAAVAEEVRAGTTTTRAGSTAGGVDTAGTMAPGPDRVYFWVTCDGSGGGRMSASTCGPRTSFDTALELVHGEWVRDAGAFTDEGSCGLGETLEADVPPGLGLRVLFVDGSEPTASGDYELRLSVP